MAKTSKFGFQCLIALCMVGNAFMADPSSWYTAYSEYPLYCSTPDMMKNRAIPSLRDHAALGDTRLVHVTTVLRHGSRTPSEGGYQCWKGYWDDPATGHWDCDLKQQMVVPTNYDGSFDGSTTFEKHYDALNYPDNDLSNDLPGTCQVGQLLLQGVQQQMRNGKLLRDAYCYDSETYDHDVRLRLLDVNPRKNPTPWSEPSVYLRADDYQRTVMSGDVLIRSMFETEIESTYTQKGSSIVIQTHVNDKDRDVLDPNERICPRLKELSSNIERSSIFRSFNSSKEAKRIHKVMKNDLGWEDDGRIIDCLMTTICSDRPLPPAIGYGSGSNTFEQLMAYDVKRHNMYFLANDAEYSKLAMAPVWAEIMDRINPIIKKREQPLTRLSIFSGHDTTIAPLMASLGIWNDTMWPSYASMFILELHELVDGVSDRSVFQSNFAFRLIFEGEVVTSQMDGCLDDLDLCDVTVLTDRLAKFGHRDRNCNYKKSIFSSSGSSGDSSFFHSFLMVLIGALLGIVCTFYMLTGSFPIDGIKGRIAGYSNRTRIDGDDNLSIPPVSYRDEPGNDFHD